METLKGLLMTSKKSWNKRKIIYLSLVYNNRTSYYKDPNSIKMFPYYFEYGNMLLRKTENTNELFTNAMA